MSRLSSDAHRVIASLEAQPQTELQLIEALDLRPSVLRTCVQQLIVLDLVHIAAQVRERGNGRLIATYAAGSKVRPSARPRRPKSVERLAVPVRSIIDQWTGKWSSNARR
jgi:hypothetical protein